MLILAIPCFQLLENMLRCPKITANSSANFTAGGENILIYNIVYIMHLGPVALN